MNRLKLAVGVVVGVFVILSGGVAVTAQMDEPSAMLLASGLEGASGSVVGPDGALYVTEGVAGSVSRIDPESGEVTSFATGLPPAVAPLGGAMDIAFIGDTAYVLVTMVGPDLNPSGDDVVGIYRVDGPDSFTVIADIGDFSISNPPPYAVDVPSGLQYALDVYDGGFMVTDGHHNRVLYVTLEGEVSERLAFDNIVPTGLAVSGDTIYLAEAGPVPHAPETGKVMMFGPDATSATEVAAGAPLLVDVEFGRGGTLYALSQGIAPEGTQPGGAASEDTGALVRVNDDGTFTTVVDELNTPTSLEFIGNTAYVTTLAGEVWAIDGVE